MEPPDEPSDTQRELRELRVRAYGPAADIERDPVAIARLVELESLHRQARATTGPPQGAPERMRVAPPPRPSPAAANVIDHTPLPLSVSSSSATADSVTPGSSLWQRALTTRGGRLLLGIAAGVATSVLIYGAHWLTTPRPVATLHPAAAVSEGGAGTLDRWIEVSNESDLFISLTIDQRTLTPYGTFRGVEVWSAVDELDNPCLVLVDESSQRTLEGVCTPRSGELIADVGAWPRLDDDFARGLAAGTVFRFQQRGATIDAFVIEPPRDP
jgi:hypothetical protein